MVLPEGGETHPESELHNLVRPSNEGVNIKLEPELSDLGFHNGTDEDGNSSDDTIVDEQLQSNCMELIEREDQGMIKSVIEEDKLVTTRKNVTAMGDESRADKEEVTEMAESFHVNGR